MIIDILLIIDSLNSSRNQAAIAPLTLSYVQSIKLAGLGSNG
jgi:hypothetical protein